MARQTEAARLDVALFQRPVRKESLCLQRGGHAMQCLDFAWRKIVVGNGHGVGHAIDRFGVGTDGGVGSLSGVGDGGGSTDATGSEGGLSGDDGSGCACSADGRTRPSLAFGLLVLGLHRRRRAHASATAPR